MRILVTGSNGFIGRHLIAELKSRGHLVLGIDKDHTAERRCDITEFRQLEDTFKRWKPELVYHLGAEFGRRNGSDFYEQMWRTNVIGTQNVIQCCIMEGSKLVFASSSEIYGHIDTEFCPSLDLNESWINPGMLLNEYALSKWTNEKQIQIAMRRNKLKAVILRFFNAYGPGEFYSPYRSVVAQFCWKMLNNEPITAYWDYWRNFCYITDLVTPVANVAERFDSLKDSVFNIGGAEYASIEQLCSEIENCRMASYLEGEMKINWRDTDEGNVRHKRPDLTRQIEQLGHEPKVKLAQGIPVTLAWMRNLLDNANREV